MKPIEKFLNRFSQSLPSHFLAQLDKNFSALEQLANQKVVRSFVNASGGAVVKYLPNGNTSPDKDYLFVKTDSSVNTVTITAFGTQLIIGASTRVLSAQGDAAWLAWDTASQRWWVV